MGLLISNALLAQQKEVKLWDEIPGSIAAEDYKEEQALDGDVVSGYSKVSEPTLTIFEPESGKATGTAVVICPGGGYSHLAINKEGYKLGAWFAEQGVTGFVLKNRLPSDAIMKDKTIGPLQDAQRAIRYVRQNASTYGIDTSKVGIMGFSAGGHLASTAATHYADHVYESTEGVSAKPDFSMLIYPVISLQRGITHQGSRDNLLGKNASQEAVYKFSGEYQVTPETPMTFLVHATDDGAVSVANSINYYLALKDAGVPVEMHIYEDGGHGFGMGRSATANSWPEALSLWLKKHDLITK
ncbi:Acetyl esterase/lipase [Leeuwenhoekiella marinoflava DSM 3653]|uniref:Acetyl esterase/lipase n=3 Tax=Leeuwenhoekiella marinoflava TaxID=988 RepID=A0A4Q0PEV2_9FLAO|nr:acetyl esterase/lipase [Leeuwenhoekiella marinoflava]SHF88202.1 Acetyl esterase/lipase [Leeuwenhoekiella marinoflava DSM 3653]